MQLDADKGRACEVNGSVDAEGNVAKVKIRLNSEGFYLDAPPPPSCHHPKLICQLHSLDFFPL